MLFGLMTGAGEEENPAHERRWNMLFIVLDTCVPEHNMEDLKEYVRAEKDAAISEFEID